MSEELEDTIREAAQQPAEVSIDGETYKQHPLPDQVAVDEYLTKKRAARDPRRFLRGFKLVPPGTA